MPHAAGPELGKQYALDPLDPLSMDEVKRASTLVKAHAAREAIEGLRFNTVMLQVGASLLASCSASCSANVALPLLPLA